MSGGFPKAKYREVARALARIGYRQVRTNGRHSRWEDGEGKNPVTILEGKSGDMISRTVWSGLKSQLGDKFEALKAEL
ncbi:MAG TPA: type II toxin-antitoxin system HicA family toxin [Candidatus Thermoplasmatota archaeon]|nr:type II toxin-antitoxin system HicA family toxin [Candidatus Thermoplasmatota archaeon]